MTARYAVLAAERDRRNADQPMHGSPQARGIPARVPGQRRPARQASVIVLPVDREVAA